MKFHPNSVWDTLWQITTKKKTVKPPDNERKRIELCEEKLFFWAGHTCTYTHAHTHTHTHRHKHVHKHTHTRTHTHTCMCMHTHTHTHTLARAQAHTHARARTHTRACTHTHAHTLARAQAQTHTHARTTAGSFLSTLPSRVIFIMLNCHSSRQSPLSLHSKCFPPARFVNTKCFTDAWRRLKPTGIKMNAFQLKILWYWSTLYFPVILWLKEII